MQTIIGPEFPKKVIPLIENAKKSIKIVVFDWRWYPNDPSNPVQLFNQSIVRAARRGVSVSAITSCVDIVKTLRDVGCDAKKLNSRNLVHAKMMMIDDSVVILGSHNYSQSAFTLNHEISVILNGESDKTDFDKFFKSLWQL